MLVTIAAAALALAPVQRPDPAPSAPAFFVRPGVAPPTEVCKGAARVQTAYEPALLYRQGPNDRAKRLIDMPMAQACRLGGTR